MFYINYEKTDVIFTKYIELCQWEKYSVSRPRLFSLDNQDYDSSFSEEAVWRMMYSDFLVSMYVSHSVVSDSLRPHGL